MRNGVPGRPGMYIGQKAERISEGPMAKQLKEAP
jgi:hypothetical protein